jgi:serine/threonine protein kinase/Tfp pilus assembly protein PilF
MMSDELIKDKTVSHYQILEKIGQGGMGEVFLAEDIKLDRKVALKFLPKEFTKDMDAKERFKREAKATAALNHPNIVTIYEINEHEDQTYIAMEYVEGETLKEIIIKNSKLKTDGRGEVASPFHMMKKEGKETLPLHIDEIINIAIQICEGLQKAHEAGIVHRDIKPQNIIINKDNQVKILDFGLAKLKGVSQLTREQSTLGTLHYMSPEQFMGKTVDHMVDIWSVGIILYEMVTGHLPFKGDYEQAIMYAVMNEQPEPIAVIQAGLSKELNQIISNILEKEKENRYQNTGDVIKDLKILKKKIETKIPKEATTDTKKNPSIAVLPFRNMSSEAEQEYFCEGISEEIINALSHIKDLRVIARTSAFAFKDRFEDVREIGKRLGVETLLEGSVRKAGNQLRITAQLIKASDGSHIWSEKYDRSLEDIFAIQDEISMSIVDNLKIKLLEKEKNAVTKGQTDNLDAYQNYLKGWYFLSMTTPQAFERAFEYFQEALREDPDYAGAYVGQARGYMMSSMFGNIHPRKVYPKARSCIEKALRLDNTQGEAYAVLGFIQAMYDWDWASAEENFIKALSHKPNSAMISFLYSFILCLTGRHSQAISSMQQVLRLDPLSPYNTATYANMLRHAHKFDEAIRELKKSIESHPDYWYSHFQLGCAYWENSMFKESLHEFEMAVDLSNRMGLPTAQFIAFLYKSGNWETADKMLADFLKRSQTEYFPPVILMVIYWGRNEFDKAFQWLEKAYEEHDTLIALYLMGPSLEEKFINDHRFQDILKKVGVKRKSGIGDYLLTLLNRSPDKVKK